MIKEEQQSSEVLVNALETMVTNGLPQHDAVEYFDVGTANYLSYFEEEIIKGLISKGGATCRFFEGAYGSGKTHMLHLLAAMALRRGLVVARTDLSQALSLEDWRLITLYILENMEVRISGETVRSLPEILMAFGKTGRANLDALRNANLPQSGFRNAMIYAVQGSGMSDLAWQKLRQFLLGQKVGVTELKRLGLTGIKGPLTGRNAELVLKTVLKGLFLLGFPGTMLLFDENEKTLVAARRVPPKKVLMAANLMRRLIDGCTTGPMVGTAVVFAVLPGFLGDCAQIYPALHQRLTLVRGLNRPAWRWPVLPIELTNTAREPEDFLEQAITMFEEIVVKCGGSIAELKKEMETMGEQVLERNVGTGYKRELMKILATLAMNRL